MSSPTPGTGMPTRPGPAPQGQLAATPRQAVVPQHVSERDRERARQASERFATEHPDFSAKEGLRVWQSCLPAAAIGLVAAGMLMDWRLTVDVVFTVANVAFLVSTGFKVVASFLPGGRAPRRRPTGRHSASGSARGSATAAIDTDDLPVYSILVPVFQEAGVIASIMTSFERFDYPHDKLDVLILMEEGDQGTIDAARAADPPPWMRLVVVPDGSPRTKPRACNYGLAMARGQYVVIYDAEDRPEPDQLRKAVQKFQSQAGRTNERPLACVQAALSFYNPDYNALTRMFSVEYAQWFDRMLPGLTSVGVSVPLGGTSNHFRRDVLLDVGGWDPYNVTEDADLGLRLAASGYRVDMIDSTTWEEATPRVWPWIRQRTRWIKGYLLTGAVNLRRPIRWLRRNRASGAVTMGGLLLATPANFLLYPVTLGFTLLAWLIGPVVQIRLPHPILVLGLVNMVVTNLAMILVSGVATWRRYNWRISSFAVFLPAYWLLHAVAAWRAMIQMVFSPNRWEKTPHGLMEDYDDSTVDNGGLAHSARL